MSARPSFDTAAALGRISLLIGAYAPALAVLGLRIGPGAAGWGLVALAVLGAVWWLLYLLYVAPRSQAYDITIDAAEPIDREVTAYIATYLLPVLAAKPSHPTGYVAYGLA